MRKLIAALALSLALVATAAHAAPTYVMNFFGAHYLKEYVQLYRTGWRWSLIKSDPPPRAYPDARFGRGPWDLSSNVSYLPKAVSLINSFAVTYGLTETVNPPISKYDTSFDIWVTSANPPTSKTMTYELMIWLNHNNVLPCGPAVGTLSTAGHTWTKYQCTRQDSPSGPKWQLITYAQDTAALSGSFDAVPFMQDAGIVSGYVADIELGNELWQGSGITTINSFTVSIN